MQRARTLTTALPTLRTRTAPSALSLFLSPLRSYSSVPTPPPAPAAGPISAASLGYFVPRSRHGELPVYTEYKNGGSRVLTIVRKVEGDIEALRKDLSSFLSSVPSLCKPAQGQVVLRGDWVREVKEWLGGKGF